MKIYITEKLKLHITELADITENISETEINDIKEQILIVLINSGIKATFKNQFLIIEEQYITISEISANILFDMIFYLFKIEYANMGGAGSDFNINVSN